MKYNRIYAYTTTQDICRDWVGERKGTGYYKVGQTKNTSEERVKQQMQGNLSALVDKTYQIVFDREAVGINGVYFSDSSVHKWLEYMGCYRVSHTEWFECTVEEIEKAFELARTKGTPRKVKKFEEKDTVNSRGGTYNKEVTLRDRKILTDSQKIINTIIAYEDAVSNKPIAQHLIDDFGITQYALTTAANYVGEATRKLINLGILINEGTFSIPKLSVAKKYLEDTKLIEKESLHQEANISLTENNSIGTTKEQFEKFINSSKVGRLCSELREFSGYKLNKVHKLIKKYNWKKIYVKTGESNMDKIRVFLPNQHVLIPDNEVQIIKSNIGDYRGSLSAQKRKEIFQGLTAITDFVRLSTFLEKYNVHSLDLLHFLGTTGIKTIKVTSINRETCLKRINSLKGENPIKWTLFKNIQNTEQKIYSLLMDNPEGLSIRDIRGKLDMGEMAVRKVINNWLGDKVQKVHVTDYKSIINNTHPKSTTIYFLGSSLEQTGITDFMLKYASRKICYRMRRAGITENNILDIIRDNPLCSAENIASALHKKYPKYSCSSYNDVVAHICKGLRETGKIINLPGGRGGFRYKLQENKISLKELDIEEEVIKYVCKNPGCTIKEIYQSNIWGIGQIALYQRIRQSRNLELTLVVGSNGGRTKKFYRVNLANTALQLHGDTPVEYFG